MPLIDVSGAHCPMGCGQTLHLSTASGMISCLDPGCSDKGAAQRMLSAPQPVEYHVRVAGAFCPMGCGQTLSLLNTGYVHCMADGCPQPDAARKILADPEHLDVVIFGADSWTVRHPLRERLGDLATCPVNAVVATLGRPPDGKTGAYRARITESGLDLERVPD